MRWNAWTEEADFAWWDAEEDTDPGTASSVSVCRHEDRPDDTYPWYYETGGYVYTQGNLSWLSSYARAYFSAGGGVYVQYFLAYPSGSPVDAETYGTKSVSVGSILEDAEIEGFDYIAMPSISRIGGSLYLEFRLLNYGDPEALSDPVIRVYCAKINVGRVDNGDSGDVLWVKQLYEIRGELVDLSFDESGGPDLIHAKFPDDDAGEPVERLAFFYQHAIFDEEGDLLASEPRCGTVDAITGEDPASFYCGGAAGVISDGEGKIWGGGGMITLNSSSEDDGGGISWEIDLEALGVDSFQLFHVAGGHCYGWGSWTQGTETITHTRISNDEEDWGETYYVDEEALARGHSRFQGIVQINADTGAFLGKTDSGDEAVFEDYLYGPTVQSVHTDTFSYNIPRGLRTIMGGEDDGDIVEGPIYNLLDELKIPNYEQYFFRDGVYPHDDHSEENNPYLTAYGGSLLPPTSISGYDAGDTAAAPYVAAWDAIREDYIAHQVAFIDDACDARIQGTEEMDAQRVKVNFPQHPLWSGTYTGTIGVDASPIVTYMDLNMTDIRVSTTPPVTPPDDLLTVPPKMGAYFSANMTDMLSNRPFRPYPRVPQDWAETNQNVGGVPQKWVHFDEYKPYIGNPDQGPFEGLWSLEAGEDYDGSFSFYGGCGDSAEGQAVTIEQSIIWLGSPEEQWERTRTSDPLYTIFPCAYDGECTIHGPRSWDGVQESWPAVWAQFKRGVPQWKYTYTGDGRATWGTPIPLRVKRDEEAEESEILYFTFFVTASEWKVLVLDSEGALVAELPGAEGMLNPAFTGNAFRENSKVWKP